MLVRALIYRLTTDEAVGGPEAWTTTHLDSYRPAIEVALSFT
jgi:hypothetical protein